MQMSCVLSISFLLFFPFYLFSMDEKKIKHFCLGPDISEDLVLVEEIGEFAQSCNEIFLNPKNTVSLTDSQHNTLFKALVDWKGKEKICKVSFDFFAERIVDCAQRRAKSFKLVYEEEKDKKILADSLKQFALLKSNITIAVKNDVKYLDSHRDSTLLKIMTFLIPYHKEKIITMKMTKEEKKRLGNLGESFE